MLEEGTIRLATEEDAAALREIYSYYVRETAVSFELEPPSVEEFARRIALFSEKYPYLVLEEEDGITGFAYAHAFHERAAFAYCAETTVYLHPDARGEGRGRALYAALEAELKRMGVRNLYAAIAMPEGEDAHLTTDSPRFHEAAGFRTCAFFRSCGYKFNRWYNMVWMEKHIGEETASPAPLLPYPAVMRGGKPVCKPFSAYDDRTVRLVTKSGYLFYGIASHILPGYGLHEYNVEQEGLQVGMYVCFADDIENVELVT